MNISEVATVTGLSESDLSKLIQAMAANPKLKAAIDEEVKAVVRDAKLEALNSGKEVSLDIHSYAGSSAVTGTYYEIPLPEGFKPFSVEAVDESVKVLYFTWNKAEGTSKAYVKDDNLLEYGRLFKVKGRYQ